MVEPLRQPRFALEASEQHWILRLGGGQNLDGNQFVVIIAGAINTRHPAATDAIEDLVPAEKMTFRMTPAQQGRLILGEKFLADEPASPLTGVVGFHISGVSPPLESGLGTRLVKKPTPNKNGKKISGA